MQSKQDGSRLWWKKIYRVKLSAISLLFFDLRLGARALRPHMAAGMIPNPFLIVRLTLKLWIFSPCSGPPHSPILFKQDLVLLLSRSDLLTENKAYIYKML